MINPHGGKLKNCLMDEAERQKLLNDFDRLSSLTLDSDLISDVENIATGVYSPLEGFMTSSDFESVLKNMRLADDLPWTIPIVIDIDRETALKLKIGEKVALRAEDGQPVAVLNVEDKYSYDKEQFALKVYGTTDLKHPGVARLSAMKEILLGGKLEVINLLPTPFDGFRLSPRETRLLFREKGWKTVVGFQTRNTPHLGHEYVQKTALTFTDGLFINPVIGRKKKGDFKDEVILASYEELIKHYYLKDRAVMAILKMEMRYAGPREAIHHAIIRKNFGCSHIINISCAHLMTSDKLLSLQVASLAIVIISSFDLIA